MVLEPLTLRRCERCGRELPVVVGLPVCSVCSLEHALDQPPDEAATPLQLDDLPDPAEPLPSIPGFEFNEVIGRGGMGVVYRARQTRLKRVVAVKLLLPGALADEATRVRFQQEAQAVAQLRHPGIVPVFEAGEHEGQPWFAMEYVAGSDLAHLPEPLPLSPPRAARIIEVLGDALQCAHDHGVLHRDLKPSNILLDAEGQPRLTDFGLARRMDVNPELTLPGQALGSPGYIAPEQAAGNRQESGPASDVYSLGAVLYFLLTGRAPFLAATLAEALEQVLHRDPVRPRDLNPSVPPALETITLKCLEKRPEHRYRSAAALGQDLARFLGDQPIQARPPSRWNRMVRRVRSQPAVAVLALLAALGLLSASGLGVWVGQQGRAEARNAQAAQAAAAARAEAERVAKEAELRRHRVELYGTRLASAYSAWQRGDARLAIEQFSAAQTVEPGWEYRHLRARFTQGQRILRGHGGQVLAVAFTPDGRRLVSGGTDRSARVWDVATGELVQRVETARPRPSRIAFSKSGSLVWACGSNLAVEALDLEAGKLRHVVNLGPASLRGLAVHPDDQHLVVGTDSSGIRVWDMLAGAEVRTLPASAPNLNDLALAPDGTRLATCARDGTIAVQDFASGQLRWQRQAHEATAWHVAFDATGDRLLSIGGDGRLRVWGAADGEEGFSVVASTGPLRDAVFSPDGQWIATAGLDLAIRLWRADTGASVATLLGHTEPPLALAFSSDGHLLASGGRDRAVRVWDLAAAQVPSRVIVHTGMVQVVAVSADGQEFLSWGADQRLVWGSTSAPDQTRTLPRADVAGVTAIAFAPAGRLAVMGTVAGSTDLWESHGEAPRQRWADHSGAVRCVAWNGDGSLFATGGDDGVVRIREVATGSTLVVRPEQAGEVRHLAFSRDGRRLASVAGERSVRLWDVPGQRQVPGLWVSRASVLSLVATEDGFLLATRAADERVAIHPIEEPDDAIELVPREAARFRSAALSADGRRLFGIRERSLSVWDVETGVLLLTLSDASPAVLSSFALSAEQRAVVVGDNRGGLTVFGAAPANGGRVRE